MMKEKGVTYGKWLAELREGAKKDRRIKYYEREITLSSDTEALAAVGGGGCCVPSSKKALT